MRADIAEMIAELDGTDLMWEALDEQGARRRATAVQRTRLWRIQNPRKWHAQRRRARKQWKAKHPAKVTAAKKRYRARHLSQVRARDARNQQARRDRLRRQPGGA